MVILVRKERNMTKTTKTSRHALRTELKALKVERIALALSQDPAVSGNPQSWTNGTAARKALLDREMALCDALAAQDSRALSHNVALGALDGGLS